MLSYRLVNRPVALGWMVALGAVALVLAAPHGALKAQSPSRCTVVPNKVAAPPIVLLGETVTVTLTLDATCPTEPAPLDVILVMDQSSSMLDDNKMDNAKAAALAFLQAVDLDASRVGLVAFNDVAGLRSGLTQDRGRLERAIAGLRPGGRTNVSAAIDLARAELLRDATPARPVMIVLTDGYNTTPGAEPIADAADRAKAAGITIAAFCAGGECDPELAGAASEAALYFDVPDTSELPRLYRDLAGTLQANDIVALTIRDEIPSNMRYIVGSAVPPPDRSGPGFLEWDFLGLPPAEGIRYLLEPLEIGRHPTNVVAIGTFRDRQGGAGQTEFPLPQVRVIATPDCIPEPVEVFFLIDDSNCLYGQMLNDQDSLSAIKKGVERVLDQLDLGVDRAAVIGFGDRAITFQTLTGDRQLILDAVDRVAMRDSSARLDLAFQATARELASERHDANARPATITVTDGPMMQTPELAELAGLALRADGVRHYAIGVGFVTQHAVLRSLSEPGGYFELPFGGDVITPYAQIGGLVTALRGECFGEPDPTATPWERPGPFARVLLPAVAR